MIRLSRSIRNLSVLIILAGAGWGLGSLYTHVRQAATETASTEAVEADAEERLHRFARDVGEGRPWPPMFFWRPGTDSALSHDEVLTEEALVMLVTVGCNDCLEDVQTIQRMADSIGHTARTVIIVADRAEGAGAMSLGLTAAGVRFPFYCDAEQRLRNDHAIVPRTVYFVVDDARIVTKMTAWKANPREIAHLLERP